LSPQAEPVQQAGPKTGPTVEPQDEPAAIDMTPKRRRTTMNGRPLSLSEFIAASGGIRDESGELRARDLHNHFIPGIGRLVRKTGMTHEQALEAATEAGYFRDETGRYGQDAKEFNKTANVDTNSLDDLRNALERDARERDPSRKHYSDHDQDRVPQRQADAAQEHADAYDAVAQALTEAGYSQAERHGPAMDHAAQMLLNGEESDPFTAYERAVMNMDLEAHPAHAAEFDATPVAEKVKRDEVHTGRAPAGGAGGGQGGQEGSAGQQGAAGVAEPATGASGAGQDGEQVRQRPAEVEPGADGKPQTVIPGAERISDAELAQKKAEEGLKPKAPQKDTDGLNLFGDGHKQGDLLDAPRPEPKAEAKPEPEPEAKAPAAHPDESELDRAFAERMRGEGFQSIIQARKLAAQHGVSDLKKVEETLEAAIVKVAREIVDQGMSPAETFDALKALYERQPRLAMRTSTSIENQAYSTPIPLAYVASRLAHASEGWVLEPTAGNGALLIEVDPAQQSTTINELNPERAAALKAQGFNTTETDASRHGLFKADSVDVVIANPPFGVVKEDGRSKRFDMSWIQDRYQTNEIDHAISLNALSALRQNGRAVLIIGSVNKQAESAEARGDAYNGKAKREFFKVLYDNYKVVDHFTVAGELYEKQGAGWPVDVIVIDGKGKSAKRLPGAVAPPILSSWEQVKDKLNVPEARTGSDARPAGTGLAATGQGVGQSDVGDQGDGSSSVGGGSSVAGTSGGRSGAGGRSGSGGQSGASGGSGRTGERSEGGNSERTDQRPDSEQGDGVGENDEPSFLKTFSPARRALWDAWEPANKQVAWMLGKRLDAMRANGADAERIAHLQGKLNDILSIIPEPRADETPQQAGQRGARDARNSGRAWSAEDVRRWYDDFVKRGKPDEAKRKESDKQGMGGPQRQGQGRNQARAGDRAADRLHARRPIWKGSARWSRPTCARPRRRRATSWWSSTATSSPMWPTRPAFRSRTCRRRSRPSRSTPWRWPSTTSRRAPASSSATKPASAKAASTPASFATP
jgi:predicted RNA methylase